MNPLVGHRVAHFAIAVVCLSRAWAFSDLFGAPRRASPGPEVLTDNGQFLWMYATLWALIGVWAIYDGIRGKTRWAVPMFIGIMTVWGISYAISWSLTDFTSHDWTTFILYVGVAGVVLGKHMKVYALSRRVHSLSQDREAHLTKPLNIESGDEHGA